MPRVGFEPTISAGERQKTYALDRAATGTGGSTQLQTLIWGEQTVWGRRKDIIKMEVDWIYPAVGSFSEQGNYEFFIPYMSEISWLLKWLSA